MNILQTEYVPPQMDILLISVEKGFAGSDDGEGSSIPKWEII